MIFVAFTRDYTSRVTGARASTYQQMAQLGASFFYTLAWIQISLVMLAAPAATAGSICMDRARGTLVHMLMTDLSDAEIVLGKLGSRLAPVMGLIMCGVPVAALAALLGGIEFASIFGLFSVSVALVLLGCSLAIMISVWATKTHEVLIALYLIEGLWLLALPLWWGWTSSAGLGPPPDWFQKANPYVLVFSPFNNPGFVGITDVLIFSGIILALSASLVVVSIAKLRRVVVEQSGRRQKLGLRLPTLKRMFPSWAGPSLDGNPVLWREWHRNHPSRLARLVWVTILTLSWGLAAWGTYGLIHDGTNAQNRGLGLGMMLQLVFGMLILSATAPTALAEERVRGSLDILMTTPLRTSEIVVGKWLGASRSVLVLVLLPIFIVILLAGSMPEIPEWIGRFPQQATAVPLTSGDRILAVVFCTLDMIVSCAILVSLGLLIATWVPRLGRAVAISVAAYFLIGIGWVILVQFLFQEFRRNISSEGVNQVRWIETCLMALSPIFGPMMSITVLEQYWDVSRAPIWNSVWIVILAKAAFAGTLLWLTINSFDRCMGRVSEWPHPPGKQRSTTPAALIVAPATS